MRAIVITLIAYHLSLVTSLAQGFLKWEADSVPLFRGVSVGFDLAGALQMQLSDYGQYEASARVNLHDQYFPTVELGYGRASHEEDQVTGISYHTSAPYLRLGADVNLLKKKHTGNRVFAGLRYAFTSYKVDITHEDFRDPLWGWLLPALARAALRHRRQGGRAHPPGLERALPPAPVSRRRAGGQDVVRAGLWHSGEHPTGLHVQCEY